MIIDIITILGLPTLIAFFTWAEMHRNHAFRLTLVLEVIEFAEVMRKRVNLTEEFYQAHIDLQEAKMQTLHLKIQKLEKSNVIPMGRRTP